MPAHDIVCIGASTGGIAALQAIMSGLPAGLPATILIVQHVHAADPGYLPEILSRAGALPVHLAVDGQAIQRGLVLVAPAERHLLVTPSGHVRLSRGPRENRVRPAIDALFRSAALAFGARVVGVILTGELDDGTLGMRTVKLCGGTTVVQDPAGADAPSMPRSALQHVKIDHVVSLHDIAPLLSRLTSQQVSVDANESRMIMPKELEIEAAIATGDTDALAGIKTFGEPSLFTCPECHGVLTELREKNPMRFRCHTGHAFTAATLRQGLQETSEEALWSTIRILQERAMLMSHMAHHARAGGELAIAEQWDKEAAIAKQTAEQIHRIEGAAGAAE